MSTRTYKKRTTTKIDYAARRAARKAIAIAKARSNKSSGLYRSGGFYGRGRGIEKKTVDTTGELQYAINGLSDNATAPQEMVLINGVASGTNVNQRVGRRIVMKSIYIRGYIFTGTTPLSFPVRTMLVLDKQANGAAPTMQQILGSFASAQADIDAPNNLDNRERFKIMMDKMTIIQVNGGTSGATSNAGWIQKYKKCNIPVTFNNVGLGISSISTNSLWLCAVGPQVHDSASNHRIFFSTRVRFTDE